MQGDHALTVSQILVYRIGCSTGTVSWYLPVLFPLFVSCSARTLPCRHTSVFSHWESRWSIVHMVVFRTALFCLCLFLPVIAWSQAPLPLSRTDWCDPSPPAGWTDGNGNNADRCYDTGFACSGNDMGRLDNTGEYYLVAFQDTPDELTFALKDAGMGGSSQLVLEVSPDQSAWETLGTYGSCGGCTPIVNCQSISHPLDPDIRYVRWTYTKETGNVGLDDVLITNGELMPEVGFDLPSSAVIEGNVGTADHLVSITMQSPPSGPVLLQVSDALTGSASPGSDYTFAPVILTFEPNGSYPQTQSVIITIHGDGLVEGDETIDLQLDLLSGSAELVQVDHTVTILDDDVPGAWYRTINGGDWSDLAVWEVSPDQGMSWSAAGALPEVNTSAQVHVLHAVTLDDDVIIDDLLIEAGAILEIPSSVRLEIASAGAAPHCLLEGTLVDHGIGGANGWRFQSGARWQMGEAGTLIKTGNSASSEFRDHYINVPGAPDLPEGSTVIYRYTGTGLSVSSSDWSYGHLVLESDAGFYAFNSLTSRINEFGTLTIKGTLDIGGEGTGTVQVHNQKPTTTLLGDLVVRSGCTLTNAAYNGNTPHGELIISQGPGMQLEGILQYTHGTGEVRFVQPAVVEGNADHFRCYHLGIDAEVVFALHAVVTNTLEFYGGDNVITAGLSEIRLQTTVPGAILNAGPDAYVEGRLRRDVLSGISGYAFPVGQADQYAPFNLDITSTDADNILGYFDPTGSPPGTATCNAPPPGVPAGDYDYLIYAGGWQILPDGGLDHLAQLTLTPCLGMAPWYTIALDGMYDPCPTGLTVEITDFGMFDLYGADQPLPVTWVDFQAIPFQNGVRLEWSTASEQDNRYFTAEHSVDGVQFEAIGRMAAQGQDQGLRTYVFDHLAPGAGWNYYRIRQEDLDGTSSWSPIRVIAWSSPAGGWHVNHAGGLIRLVKEGPPVTVYRAMVVDLLGRQLAEGVTGTDPPTFSTAGWSTGLYHVVMNTGEGYVVIPFFNLSLHGS